MNPIAAIVLSALLTWALERTSKDIGKDIKQEYPRWLWIVLFILFSIGFMLIK